MSAEEELLLLYSECLRAGVFVFLTEAVCLGTIYGRRGEERRLQTVARLHRMIE